MAKRVFIMVFLCMLLANAVFGGGAKEEEKKIYSLKLAHVLPAEHLDHRIAVKFGEQVNMKSSGRIKIEVFPASQLGGMKEITDGLFMGTMDFALFGFGEVAKRYPPVLIFDAPYVFRNREHLAAFFKSDKFWNLMEDMKAKVGIRLISPGYYGTRHVTTSNKAALNPSDMKGLKLRCPDQPMAVAYTKALGATPTPMAFAEVYLALQQGVVDGQENPVAAINAMKFFEVQRYLVKTGHSVQANVILGSDKTLSKLPQDLQKLIDTSGKEISLEWIQEAYKIEDALFNELEKRGMKIIEPDLSAFMKAAQPTLDSYEKQWGIGLLENIRSVN